MIESPPNSKFLTEHLRGSLDPIYWLWLRWVTLTDPAFASPSIANLHRNAFTATWGSGEYKLCMSHAPNSNLLQRTVTVPASIYITKPSSSNILIIGFEDIWCKIWWRGENCTSKVDLNEETPLTESKKRAGVAPSSAAVLDGRRRLYSPKKRAGVAPSYSTLDRSKN